MTRYCAACGTEVEDTALFCPTCGQPIDQEHEAQIPPAPAWPESAPPADSSAAEPAVRRGAGREQAPVRIDRLDDRPDPDPDDDDSRQAGEPEPTGASGWEVRHEEPTRAEQAAPPPVAPQPRREDRGPDRPPPRADDGEGSRRSVDLPITTPVMLSGWLIGVGTLIAAIGVLIGLFGSLISAIDVLLMLLLLAISATVFLSTRVPDVPNLKLVTLATVLIGFGMALDRIGGGGAGAGDLLFFFGTAAAAIGAIIVELGRDQPLGGPQT